MFLQIKTGVQARRRRTAGKQNKTKQKIIKYYGDKRDFIQTGLLTHSLFSTFPVFLTVKIAHETGIMPRI